MTSSVTFLVTSKASFTFPMPGPAQPFLSPVAAGTTGQGQHPPFAAFIAQLVIAAHSSGSFSTSQFLLNLHSVHVASWGFGPTSLTTSTGTFALPICACPPQSGAAFIVFTTATHFTVSTPATFTTSALPPLTVFVSALLTTAGIFPFASSVVYT